MKSEKEDLITAAQLIKKGGVVAVPTETVYGLAADALDDDAVKKIFKAKGRPADNPLIVHISDISQIMEKKLVKEIPEKAKMLMDSFWPGPLTIIMEKGESIPKSVCAGLDSVAIRFPSHETVKEIISLSGCPLAAPSANISGKPSPTSFAHVVHDMYGKIDAIVDGGDCKVGLESTVITMITPTPRILRPGYITKEDIEKIIGEVDIDRAVLDQMNENDKASSPGMKYKHYSPSARVILLKGSSERFIDYVNSSKENNLTVLCYDEEQDMIKRKCIPLGKKDDLDHQARKLFDALRKTDDDGTELVYAHTPQTQGVGMAIYNRLIRAAGFEVIEID